LRRTRNRRKVLAGKREHATDSSAVQQGCTRQVEVLGGDEPRQPSAFIVPVSKGQTL